MNKYAQYSKKFNITAGQIVLAQGVQFLASEAYKPNVCHKPRPFLIIKELENGRYLALSISGTFKELSCQYLIPKEICLATHFMSRESYVSCSLIYEIEDEQIIQNSSEIPTKLYAQIINFTMKKYCLGFNIGTEEQVKSLYRTYVKYKRYNVGNVIKVPYNKNYLFVYDETDKEYICLPLHCELQDDTQDAIQVLKGRSYVNYDEKFYVPKDDIMYIERYGSKDMPVIEQIKHPEEALELSIYYTKK